MRHRLRDLEQRLHAAQRLGEREDLRRRRDPRRVLVAEADHAREARPADVAHARRLAQPRGDRPRVLGVRRHPQVQRAQSAVHEEAVEGPGDGADGVLHELHALVGARVAHDHGAADGVRVPAEVLRRRVHDGVGAELQRALVDGRGERVVDRHERAALARDDALEVDHVQRRVGGRLDPDQLGLGPHRGRDRVEVGLVDHRVLAGPSARAPCPRAGRCRRRGRPG